MTAEHTLRARALAKIEAQPEPAVAEPAADPDAERDMLTRATARHALSEFVHRNDKKEG